ncbi:prolyl 3-hydroxylase 1-like [Schistocerca cancellata]|uniref:prolyl 3-hydroxylase 1-like n=1 Tax=Schistocerca cancellata TaxID=274614 RepID=UPI002118BE7C|nr:prolyl 3-hydroxylase 1-like [Schistocerca cancellata]
MAAATARERSARTMSSSRLLAILLIHLIGSAGESDEQKTCDQYFKAGVEAYLEERWYDCVTNLEKALSEYRNYRQTIVNCRTSCDEKARSSPHIFETDVEDLHFYEEKIKKTLCLMKCKPNYFRDRSYLSKEIEEEFENLKPYEYLQLCYYQRLMLQEAAQATFTFLTRNPDNEVMKANLKFYSTLPEVEMSEITNLEAAAFVPLYIHGLDAYNSEDYAMVTRYMEESLEEYLRADADCRAYCEGPFNHGWFPDFTSAISNHYTYCLKCKSKCTDKVNTVNGETHDDLLQNHYHYLQYAYFKVGDMKKACEAVATYLLFSPADETMLQNKKYYLSLPKVEKEFFKPREEAVKYILRKEYEAKLLNFIETDFTFDKKDEIETSENEIEDESS